MRPAGHRSHHPLAARPRCAAVGGGTGAGRGSSAAARPASAAQAAACVAAAPAIRRAPGRRALRAQMEPSSSARTGCPGWAPPDGPHPPEACSARAPPQFPAASRLPAVASAAAAPPARAWLGAGWFHGPARSKTTVPQGTALRLGPPGEAGGRSWEGEGLAGAGSLSVLAGPRGGCLGGLQKVSVRWGRTVC